MAAAMRCMRSSLAALLWSHVVPPHLLATRADVVPLRLVPTELSQHSGETSEDDTPSPKSHGTTLLNIAELQRTGESSEDDGGAAQVRSGSSGGSSGSSSSGFGAGARHAGHCMYSVL